MADRCPSGNSAPVCGADSGHAPQTAVIAVSDSTTQRRRVRQIHAQVALALLETVRDRDRPGELLDDENVTVTLPRRFGLSDVVDAQIRRYKEEARRGRRISESEIRDLIRLVSRRPDAERVLQDVGRSLIAGDGAPSWPRVLPDRWAMGLARKRIRRRLGSLFGGRFLRTPRGGFQLEASYRLLVEADPRGSACALVTGLAQAVVNAYGSAPGSVVHVNCRARGDDKCRWILGGSDSRGESDEKAGGGLGATNGDGGA